MMTDKVRPYIPKATRDQLKEIDYLSKLSPEEREYVLKFYKEYYNGEFNHEDPIHPEELRKDCYERNNASKRQLHSVSNEMLEEAERLAYKKQHSPLRWRFYIPSDYDPNRHNIHMKDDEDDT